jgi:hypothetical protein
MQDATQAIRCLTILAELTGFELLSQLWPVMLRIGRLVAHFRRGTPSPAAMFQFETQLQDLLREAGRVIVQWTLNQLEPDDDCAHQLPPLLRWQGDYYRRRRKSRLRNLNCLFGPIQLRRFYYQPLETSGRCLFPLQVQLGIVAGVATPALADVVARLSADLTQSQTLERLRHHGVVWGVRTLRNVVATMAEAMSEHRHAAQVEQLLAWLREAAAGSGPRRFVLSVGRDGVMVPVVKSQKCKEAAAATVSVLDRWGRRLGTIYLGQMPEALQTTLGDELTRLLEDVLSRWEGPLPRLVYVTDCGYHPTNYFEEVLSRMVNPRCPTQYLEWEWVVDYYHACQYITKLGEAIFGPGREAFAWAAKQRRVLKEKRGGVFRVLRSAGALLKTRELVGSEASYWTAYWYLRHRASKMDYVTYRRLRMPIGSGITEAACKIVFTQRFKQSGMKWTCEGGRSVLALRVIALSGVWAEVRQATHNTAPLPEPATPSRLPRQDEQIPNKLAA